MSRNGLLDQIHLKKRYDVRMKDPSFFFHGLSGNDRIDGNCERKTHFSKQLRLAQDVGTSKAEITKSPAKSRDRNTAKGYWFCRRKNKAGYLQLKH